MCGRSRPQSECGRGTGRRTLRIINLPALVLSAATLASAGAACADEADLSVRAGSGGVAGSTAAGLMLSPEYLELSGARIGEVEIVTDDIFDVEDPREDKWLFRLANRFHVVTRPAVVESQLLFDSGDPFSTRVIDESVRMLRANRYFSEAEITPISVEDGVVDLQVHTSDTWTLSPKLSFGRSGGTNSGGFGIKEDNLLGRGTAIGLSYKSTVDRQATALQYADHQVRGSRFNLLAGYSSNSDGFNRVFDFGLPFYALDSQRAGGIRYDSARRVEPLYDRGKLVGEYDHGVNQHEAFMGWSAGLNDGWVRRYTTGVVIDQHEFSAATDSLVPFAGLPADRDFVYPFFGVEIIQDRFEQAHNVDQIDRIEDRYLGTRLGFRVGYSSAQLGSSASAWHLDGEFNKALFATDRSTLITSGAFQGRWQDGAAQNSQLSVGARYHFRETEKRLLYVGFQGVMGHNLDLDNPVFLGGDTGLRGYPLRYQGGDKSALFTVEQRIFTDWYPFRVFRVGGAVFFDAGRTWGSAPYLGADSKLGWLKDVGIGLRLGNSRSSVGRVLHVDLAFPLDGEADISNVQLLFEAKATF